MVVETKEVQNQKFQSAKEELWYELQATHRKVASKLHRKLALISLGGQLIGL